MDDPLIADDPLITTGVSMERGGRTVVDGVSFRVRPGEVVALLGSNGAGKTTLVDGILGVTPLAAGSVTIHGDPPARARHKRTVAACLQDGGLPHDLSVSDAVGYYAAVAGTELDGPRLLDRFGLSGVADRKVAVLSGGERRRLQVALATAREVGLLILDEPTAALDVDARAMIWTELVDHVAFGTGALLFTTHLVEEAERYADRVVFLQDGGVVHDETTAALRARVEGLVVVRARSVVGATALPELPGSEATRIRGGMLECHTRAGAEAVSALTADPRFTAVQTTPATLEDVLFGRHRSEGATA
ncbi:ABC transporter ATP-binding protein [Tsukamurella sp. NPDC003166]|uniref:ABC transporter ATP-binding protein n=1 Tax=Tsukamurella sp. NPDC003166 TaxID=3154444 RepID=UPI0033BE9871